jgi:flagellar biogenesis protein FliO
MVQATFAGSATVYECESGVVLVTVEEPSFFAKNMLFIGGGLGGALAAVGVVVYLKKYRR